MHRVSSHESSNPDQEMNGTSTNADASKRPIMLLKAVRKPVSSGKSRRCHGHTSSMLLRVFVAWSHFLCLTTAVFVPFDNCLSPNIVNSNSPKQLQFVPLFAWAAFDVSEPSHNLNITIYGNVDGIATQSPYPNQDDPSWSDPLNDTGKIPDEAGPEGLRKYTTFSTSFHVLGYTPYNPPAARFCNTSALRECPWGPVFNFTGDSNHATQLPAMSVAHDLYSSYAFTSLNTFLNLKSGDVGAAALACVRTSVTPQLGTTLSNTLGYVPLVILILVAIATASAAIFSPWGSTDIFRFTSNYGRDDDLLRLVTPGFGDCLQYLQFIVLAGSLSLNYPGFFQPAVSQVSWSALMFNESFVSHGNGFRSVVDGLYVANGTYGMNRMSQLVGMSANRDIWAGMMIWLLAIIAAVIVLVQIGFFVQLGYHFITKTQQEDLRRKNIPFSLGNAIRVVFNYFLLPIVALSCYQLVVAKTSPGSVVGPAAFVLAILVCFAGFLLWLIASTRPRSYLFDDLPTVLLYGPLYNTYSDNAATFALVPVMLTFLRGIAIGAVQPSGIAQLVLLAICEVVTILTLNAFRPFHSPTSMNAFHTFFAVVRLVTILLSVAFLPSLGISDAPRGWVGYIILLLHAIVLVFGFFLNAVQTLIEVMARLAGAGGEDGRATRGGLVRVFGMRQLSRRNPRSSGRSRQSVGSTAAILSKESDQKSLQWNGGRSRSVSGSSAILLNRSLAGDHRQSMGLESVSAGGTGDTPVSGGASAFSFIPGGSQAANQSSNTGGIVNLRNAESADPYYRPPRPRKSTLEALSTQGATRTSWTSAEMANRRWSHHSPEVDSLSPPHREPTLSGRGTPLSQHMGAGRDRADSDAEDSARSKTDYATREVDFYYGVRGPALSNQPTRRLKTGPADPTGPVSSASGWIKGLLGGKTKEKGKGFEVVRSSRAPPISRRVQSGDMMSGGTEPYSDEARERSRALAPSDEGDAIGAGTLHVPENQPNTPGSNVSQSEDDDSDGSFWDNDRPHRMSAYPPVLPNIETPGGIELPSRIGSKASSNGPTRQGTNRSLQPPSVPRRSSKRDSSTDLTKPEARLSTVLQSPAATPPRNTRIFKGDDAASPGGLASRGASTRLPFSSHKPSASHGTLLSDSGASYKSNMFSRGQPEDDTHYGHERHSSSVLGAHDFQNERPTSLGYVQHHRASDHIHTGAPALIATQAELVDGSADRRSVSPDRGSSVGQAL